MRYEIWQVPADLAQELGIILFFPAHQSPKLLLSVIPVVFFR